MTDFKNLDDKVSEGAIRNRIESKLINLNNSLRNFFDAYKDKPSTEIRQKFGEKYGGVINNFLKARKEYLDEKRKLQSMKDEIMSNASQEVRLKEKLLDENTIIIKRIFESAKEEVPKMEEWLFNPVSANSEFNRGYMACWVKYFRELSQVSNLTNGFTHFTSNTL